MLKIIAVAFLLLAPFKWIYVVDNVKCNGCGNCLSSCALGAITMSGPDACIDPELCDGCGNCVNYCPRNAIYKEWYTGIEEEETADNNETLSFSQNPVVGNGVTLTGATPQSEIKVIDRSGRVVICGSADEQGQLLLDMSDVPGGAYLVISDDRISVLTTI
ncbi:MAG: 4Fe-4S binding protein [Candidatus Sabulitectum sp.]|nr:4Fe-4S binding protein [Candidatus Sabulitectum sp.]